MRWALGIEYDGTDFLGWQTQHQEPTLQVTIERALSFVANEPIELVCSGRTDTGVHAACQVAHFDTGVERTARAFILGPNSKLPPTVAIRWAQPVAGDFHARFSAVARRYRYRILNRPVRAALNSRLVTWERLPLDADAMHAAAQALVGEHDFTTFRTVACQSKSPVRRLESIAVRRAGDEVHVEVRANAFLHHMVRNIVGSLLVVGRGEAEPAWIEQLLAARDRTIAGPTAPPTGLVFVGPRYPARFGLPDEISV
jgi:tRNA pseudouridine38-40 synthase